MAIPTPTTIIFTHVAMVKLSIPNITPTVYTTTGMEAWMGMDQEWGRRSEVVLATKPMTQEDQAFV